MIIGIGRSVSEVGAGCRYMHSEIENPRAHSPPPLAPQGEYDNAEHGIEPRTVIRSIDESLAVILKADYAELTEEAAHTETFNFSNQVELDTYIVKLETEMREAAKKFEFEKAATLRDHVKELRTKEPLFS